VCPAISWCRLRFWAPVFVLLVFPSSVLNGFFLNFSPHRCFPIWIVFFGWFALGALHPIGPLFPFPSPAYLLRWCGPGPLLPAGPPYRKTCLGFISHLRSRLPAILPPLLSSSLANSFTTLVQSHTSLYLCPPFSSVCLLSSVYPSRKLPYLVFIHRPPPSPPFFTPPFLLQLV